MLETKIPNLIYLNFQLSVQEPREHFIRTGAFTDYWAIVSFPEILLTFLVHNSCQRVAEFTSCVSNRKLPITNCCAAGFWVHQTILSINFPILFFCGRKFVAGRGILKGPKFSVQSHQNTFTTNITFCGWLDHRFVSGNISRFLSYKNNCFQHSISDLSVFFSVVQSEFCWFVSSLFFFFLLTCWDKLNSGD